MNPYLDQRTLAFVGSYAHADDPGVYVCALDNETGALTLLEQASGLQNPTFLEFNRNTLKLYALVEEIDDDGKRSGAAAAFDVDPASGSLKALNREPTVPGSTCHLHLDRSGRSLMVSSYHGGMIGISPVLEDGRVGAPAEVIRHTGSSLLPVQNQARPHSVFTDPANRFALVCDLGLDRIVIYRLDPVKPALVRHGETAVAPGSGPRHFAFHPSLPFGYVINELNFTVTAFAYDQELGRLSEIQTVSTLPPEYTGGNACADIHLSPDGRFLYGSNRGHDSIAVYAVDPDNGRLSVVEYASTLGGHPRGFALSPDGRFLLAANRDSNSIVSFRRDEESGRLTPTGHSLELSKPVCIKLYSV